MKQDRSVRRAARVGVLALAVLGVSILLLQPTAVLADGPAPDEAAANFEIKFMEDMIDHHMMAIMMAEVCLEKAIHEELVSTCENIIATQSQEMMMMQTWLQDWYGVSYEPEMNPGAMRQMEKLAEEFEIAFMEEMIKHHRGAIKEGEKCLDKAYHPELLNLCQNIIATQSQEIEMMQTWLCEWYGICKASSPSV